MKAVYEYNGWALGPAVEARMLAYIKARWARKKGKVHRYSLHDFGLTGKRVGAAFESYCLVCTCFGSPALSTS